MTEVSKKAVDANAPELLRAIFASSPAGLTLLDSEFRYMLINETLAAYNGVSVEEHIGKTVTEILPESGPMVEDILRNILETGEPVLNTEFRGEVGSRPGETSYFTVSYFPIPPQSQSSAVIGAVVIDITERKRAEQALEQSEEKFRLVTDAIKEVFWMSTRGIGEMVYVSPAYENLWERSRESLYQSPKSFLEAIHPEDLDRYLEVVKENHANGTPYRYEYRIVRKNGEIRWIQERGYAVPDSTGRAPLMTGICTDITERKMAEAARKSLEAQVRHTQKLESLGILAGGIAHDFNNILTGILGNAELASLELAPNSPLQENHKEIMLASVRAADLCRQMLVYSGKGTFEIESINLSSVVREMENILKVSISEKAVLEFNFSEDLPPIDADPAQIHQIVANLVTNASEALGDHSGMIFITTQTRRFDKADLESTFPVKDFPEGTYVTLQVSDNGCGMDTAIREKLFDPFFSTKFTGRGLGLAATLGIVRGHQGAILVDSDPGTGTTFTVLFPVGTLKERTSTVTPVLKTDFRGHGTVLLVDDEKDIRTVGARMLNKLGFSVLTASNGREALEMYREQGDSIDCVILDLTMPRMNGEEAFRELKRIDPNIRIILSSGYDEKEVVGRFVDIGLSDFLQKPYRMNALAAKLRKNLGGDQS